MLLHTTAAESAVSLTAVIVDTAIRSQQEPGTVGIPGGDGGAGELPDEHTLAVFNDCAGRQLEERERRVQGQPMAAAVELNRPFVLNATKTCVAAVRAINQQVQWESSIIGSSWSHLPCADPHLLSWQFIPFTLHQSIIPTSPNNSRKNLRKSHLLSGQWSRWNGRDGHCPVTGQQKANR